MSTSEITAYLYGADCAHRRLTVTEAILKPSWKSHQVHGIGVAASRFHLGGDMFAYWVRRGMEEAATWQD